MRSLASIQRISHIEPIDGKDRIVLATVKGWTVIVQKENFHEGDMCVYVEIDSVMPEKPEFEFLRSKNFRIKTMKMAGCLSQGICFPMSILPPGNLYVEKQDVTELLGVKQYEPTMDDDQPTEPLKKRHYPRFLMRQKWFRKLVLPKKESTEFPSFISKTDETRIQNIPNILGNKDTRWVYTEKLDGQSGTYAMVKHKRLFRTTYEFIVCSRNRRIPKPDNSNYWQIAKKYNIEKKLRNMLNDTGVEWIAIQGEIVGPGIQKNKYGLEEKKFYVFNFILPYSGRWDSLTALEFCASYDLHFVPILSSGNMLPDTVDEMLKIATGKSILADTLREGLVCRSEDGAFGFKAVSPDFLLKWDE